MGENRTFEAFETWKESAHVESLLEECGWDIELDEVYVNVEDALVCLIGRYSLVGKILSAFFSDANAELIIGTETVSEGEQGEDANVREDRRLRRLLGN